MKRFLIIYLSVYILLCQFAPVGVVEGQSVPLESAKKLLYQIGKLYEKGQRSQAREQLKSFMILLDDAQREVNRLVSEEKYAEAIPIADGIIDLRKKVLGADHPETAAGQTSLAELYLKVGSYDQAEALFKSALQIREKTLGPDDLETIKSVVNLAALYQAMGLLHQAEPFYRRALAGREKILGPDHPETAIILNQLALLYELLGEYDQSEPLLRRVLALREKTLGPGHPETIVSLKKLADFYQIIGESEKSEDILKKTVMLQQQRLGADHPETAASMHALAGLYRLWGRYDAAEPLYEKALAIRESSLGEDHPETAATLNELGLLYQAAGMFEKSEQALVRALEIREQTLGPDHPDVAVSLNNLGDLYRVRGEGERAEPLFKRALVIWEKSLSADHPNRAVAINNLGLLYKERHDYTLADILFQQAVAVWERAYGPVHPDLVVGLENLAVLSVAKGDDAAAFEYEKRAQTIADELIELSLELSSNDRRLAFLSAQWKMGQEAIGLAARYLADSAEARRDALDIWLKCKGTMFQQPRISPVFKNPDNGTENERCRDLVRVRRKLARLIFSGPAGIPLEDYRRKVEQLRVVKKEIEQDPALRSTWMGRRLLANQADAETVAQAMPEGTVLVEFARIGFESDDPEAVTGQQTDHYLAFVLPAGRDPVVELIDLGPAAPIDDAVTALRNEIRTGADAKAFSQSLYEQVFSRIKSPLGDAKIVFISPHSQLNLFPFELLQNPEGRYLVEDYIFHYLTSGRVIAGFGTPRNMAGSPVLLAAPDFDLDSEAYDIIRKQMGWPPVEPFSRSADLNGPFPAIPETRSNLDDLAALLNNPGTIKYTGPHATEEAVYRAHAPWILYLDTHAFFLADQKDSLLSAIQPPFLKLGCNPDDVSTGPLPAPNEFRPENPNLRSGLALAGANTTLKSNDLTQSQGLLTSEKISHMNLNGTDLVFLPTCDTGPGETAIGEGIYGLRDAFRQAGARAIIMSLWPVPEKERQELITTFYQNLVQKRIPRRQALQDAVLQEIDLLKKRYGPNPPPLYWAAFIHVGEP